MPARVDRVRIVNRRLWHSPARARGLMAKLTGKPLNVL
jgi:hypothetical protein